MYPRLEVDLNKLKQNTEAVLNLCKVNGISVAGVTKGCSGLAPCSKVLVDAGCDYLASSRLEHFTWASDYGVESKNMLIRLPMLTEVEEVISLCDASLNSEEAVIRALDEEASKQGKVHNVILMAEMGDLREGIYTKEELIRLAKLTESLENVHLLGIGTNVGCYGAIVPTEEKLEDLIAKAELIEKEIGRELEMISGGATTSMTRLLDGDMPERINNLRVGENILNAIDLEELWGYKFPIPHKDVFTLKAEVIECKIKPSLPYGEKMYDAFRNIPEFEDHGERKRALVAIGKADYAYLDDLFTLEEGVSILGASSDHTILDVTDAKRDIQVGDTIDFGVCYSTMLFLANSANVTKRFKWNFM